MTEDLLKICYNFNGLLSDNEAIVKVNLFWQLLTDNLLLSPEIYTNQLVFINLKNNVEIYIL